MDLIGQLPAFALGDALEQWGAHVTSVELAVHNAVVASLRCYSLALFLVWGLKVPLKVSCDLGSPVITVNGTDVQDLPS